MRKLTALLAAMILALNLSSCTSSDSKEDGTEDGAIAESTEGTDADLENLDAPPAENAVASSDGANEGFLDEQLPEDALGESTQTAQADTPPPSDIVDGTTPPPAMEEAPPSDVATTEAAPIETPQEIPAEAPTDTSVAAVDTGTTATTESTEPSSSMSDASAGIAASTASEPAPVAEAKPKASLKKIEEAPIHREGVLLNAVYVARSGDNYKKISKLIYGTEDKVKELKKVNPSVKPRVGDKIYYNSPVRPADDTKMMTYYEDAGLVPEVYVTQEGDNLKKLAKNWLGHKDAWKEVWATNMMLESKDALPAGTEIRYWKSAPAPVAAAPTFEAVPPVEAPKDVAMNTPPPDMSAPPPMPEAPPQAAMPEMPAPPPPAPPEMAPPPPPPTQAELAPPPPPPMEPAPEIPPPPPMEPPPVAKKAPQMGETGGMDNDMMMTLAGAGIIAAGLAAMIIVRKRRQNRDMAQAFNDTQVGT